MAEVKYTPKYVFDQIEKKLPKGWTLFHFTSEPLKWSVSRGLKEVALVYKKASKDELKIVILTSGRNTLPRFKELAKIAEKLGYKVEIMVN